jgi:hypothetical protein
MAEQQTKFATSRFNEAGVKDFACKIQQGALRNVLTHCLLWEIGTRHQAFFNL